MSFSFHFIFNSLYRVKTSITKITALQLALSTKQNNIEKEKTENDALFNPQGEIGWLNFPTRSL